MSTELDLTRDPSGEPPRFGELEAHRRELTGYCYRMLGSGFEAEDAVQETMVRAWKNLDRFEGRSSLRSWLYRIATNVCLDMHRGPQRRARPMDLSPSSTADTLLGAPSPENTWITPIADARVVPTDGDPAEITATRETIRLAFVSALQQLPPRQRAVLLLRDVLALKADETAELLDSTVASVNSALQRARATLADRDLDRESPAVIDPGQADLLERYVDAFERYDVPELLTLMHEDVVLSMPPFPLWLRGADQLGQWFLGQGIACKDSRLVPLVANGCAAYASYKPDASGRRSAWAIQVIEVTGGLISGHHNFLDTDLFGAFGLPLTHE